jgi:hypothetical protein
MSTYPVPAAVDEAGTPRNTLALVLYEEVFAKLSQSAKLNAVV